MEQISASMLNAWLTDTTRTKPVMVDVREPWELERCRIEGAQAIPLSSVPQQLNSLNREADTVMICHHGARSFQAGMFLEQQGFSRIFNLQGGVAAWARDVDPSMASY
ncbi:MAG: sulfurtransferase [Rhodocyclaceae bacterium]|nr:sulfurtransferase [Rhodocyclaceae bacterium]MBP6110453.1 sulfurtransferase [Rhodocyclaceae bacterium]MBP6280336.1 sulfurtransferase [Rhodocyclaceae bacterium]